MVYSSSKFDSPGGQRLRLIIAAVLAILGAYAGFNLAQACSSYISNIKPYEHSLINQGVLILLIGVAFSVPFLGIGYIGWRIAFPTQPLPNLTLEELRAEKGAHKK
jgi:cytochrome c biogenesis protein CcdA